MCDQPECGGLCEATRRRAKNRSDHFIAFGLAVIVLVVLAFIVNHWHGLLQLVGGLAVGLAAGYAGIRWGVPAAINNYRLRNIQQRQRVQLERPATAERLYRPAPAQPAITPPQVHNHLHIDHETAERLFRS